MSDPLDRVLKVVGEIAGLVFIALAALAFWEGNSLQGSVWMIAAGVWRNP